MKTKSVLMSIRPQYVAKILNGEKTIEVRKKFPKDYVGWVYICCTKGKPFLNDCRDLITFDNFALMDLPYNALNGKVVARFWCDKVEEIMQAKLDNGVGYDYIYDTDTLLAHDFVKKCCLDNWDLLNYFGYNHPNGEVVGYAIHISKLEVFSEPKEIGNFWKITKYTKIKNFTELAGCEQIAKAPQSYMFVEGE